MLTKQTHIYSAGFSMVEIIVAAAVFVTTVGVFVVSFEFLRDVSTRAEARTEAALLLEEGAEAMLLLRDLGWQEHVASLAAGETYWLYWDGDAYQVSAEPVPASQRYERTVAIWPAHRGLGDRYSDRGTIDPNTRRAVIEIRSVSDQEVLARSEMLIHNSYE